MTEPCSDAWLGLVLFPAYGRELLIELNVLPVFGPNNRTTTITRMATKTKMIAYSTSP